MENVNVPAPHPDPVETAISDAWVELIAAAMRMGVPLSDEAHLLEAPLPEFTAGCRAALEKLKP